MKRFYFYLMGALFFSSVSSALELDEKLTARLLGTSSSKKTVMVNRGAEDGLNVGDHAKFFLTPGVIARGVVIKASPTRSVWALYRILDENQIVSDKVVTLKIATPVKLTNDPTKSRRTESLFMEGEKANLAQRSSETHAKKQNAASRRVASQEVLFDQEVNAQNIPASNQAQVKDLSYEEQAEDLFAQTSSSGKTASSIYTYTNPGSMNKSWELFLNIIALGSSSATVSSSPSDAEFSGLDFVVNPGLEYYFGQNSGFEKWNIFGGAKFVQKSSGEKDNETKLSEYGVSGGVTYHFSSPNKTNSLIPFMSGEVYRGFATWSNSVKADTKVDSMSFGLGLGLKYYTQSGFGLRVSSGISFGKLAVDDGSTQDAIDGSETSVGYLKLGISYRF